MTQETIPASEPVPHWPGQLVSLGDHQVFVRRAPADDDDKDGKDEAKPKTRRRASA